MAGDEAEARPGTGCNDESTAQGTEDRQCAADVGSGGLRAAVDRAGAEADLADVLRAIASLSEADRELLIQLLKAIQGRL